ncbi:hypothetical protein [Phyllobacterium salinisoli]|nr:hypothetical protein [Phyllobacterium salinisoli]
MKIFRLRHINLHLLIVPILSAAVIGGIFFYNERSKYNGPIGQRKEIAAFETFFVETLARGQTNKNFKLNRFPMDVEICVFSTEDNDIKQQILLLASLLKEETYIRPFTVFKKDIYSCPNSTFLYFRVHQGGPKTISGLVGDISYIANISGINSHIDTEFSEYGMGLVMTDGDRDKAYIAVNEFIDKKGEIDRVFVRSVVQQEFVQTFLMAPDIEVSRIPISIIEERDYYYIGKDSEDKYKKNVKVRMEMNARNMCLYDIMLLNTLYSRDIEDIRSGTLGVYINYIRAHYGEIEESARRIQNDPRYKELFVSKC